MKKGADISSCERYRYSLWRIWDENKPLIGFVGLNPSTADGEFDDKTISRCIKFCEEWGFGGFYMMNLFAYRSTDSGMMMNEENPIGDDNNKFLAELGNKVQRVVVCWGNNGAFRNRSNEVLEMLKGNDLYCLAINQSGEPKHPLYVNGSAQLIPYIISGEL